MAANQTGILVVDDEPVDLIVMQRSLERAGYEVFVAENSEQALTQLNAHVSEIDLLVTDISLPGKTGLELARDCLRQKPELKILFVSGWTGAEFLDYAGIPKADPHFLPKPFRSARLVGRVRQILESTDAIHWLNREGNKAASGSFEP
jgi:two-component system, cell cycle sensor histidine kinase and response regulator CckA